MLLAEVRQRLQGHILRRARVTRLLEVERPGLLQERGHLRVEGVEEFPHTRGMEMFASPLEGRGQGRPYAAPLVAEQGEQADRGPAQVGGGMYLKAATLIGAKISDRPVINTTLGQITISGLMYKFMSAIQ